MAKIDVITIGNGTAYVSNYDPADGETVILTCIADTGETIDDVEAWDSSSHPVAFAPVPTQSFVWSDSAYGAMTIKVTFSQITSPKIDIIIDGDGTASVDNDRPDTGDTVTLICQPAPRRRIKSISAIDENGNNIPMLNDEIQTFTWNYQHMTITVEFVKKTMKRMPIWEYPVFYY